MLITLVLKFMGISMNQALTIMVDQQSYPVLSLPGRPKAILDLTVAEIYNVETKHINQAVSRNPEKFPEDFFFQLTEEEYKEVVTNCDRYKSLKYSNILPKAFTHLGCNMLATILKSEVAVRRAVQIIRAFTDMENMLIAYDKGDVLKMIASQCRMIAVLADEMYRNRTEIEDHGEKIKAVEKRTTSLEVRLEQLENDSIPSSRISTEQINILKKIVKQKGKTRENMMNIWSQFKRKFGLTRYVHLPGERFEEAVEWVKGLSI